jgi:proteasome beta subunit
MDLKSNYKNIDEMVLKGTTTVGIVCQDGVVMATDTRVVMGYTVAHKRGKKIFPIDKHLSMTIAGVVADAQNVVEVIKANSRLYLLEKKRIIPVSAAARLAANILFSSRGQGSLILQALVGGVDDSGVHLFAIDPLGSVTEEVCVSTGSGSPIAYGVLEDGYNQNILVKEGVSLVVRAVTSAMKRDAGSGNDFDVAVVTSEGYRELDAREKEVVATHANTGQ